MAQRLVRAKGKIRAARIPYRVPGEADLPDRLRRRAGRHLPDLQRGLHGELGRPAVREELCAEAIRLGRLLAELMPDEPEVAGLLALMLLIESRRAARTTAGRRPRAAGRPGPQPVGRAADRRGPGHRPAVPAAQPARPVPDPGGDQRRAQRRAGTRPPPTGRRSCALRPAPRVSPEPGRGPEPRGGGGRGRGAGGGAAPWWTGSTSTATTCSTPSAADLLRRLGRDAEAAAAYDAALARTGNAAERAFLRRSRSALPARLPLQGTEIDEQRGLGLRCS